MVLYPGGLGPREVPSPKNEMETDGPFDVSLSNRGSNIVLTLKEKDSHYDSITAKFTQKFASQLF